MSKLCNDNSKETNAYQEFLNCNNILVITLPSRFLNIISKYNPRRPNQKYRLYTEINALPIAKADAVLVDNSITGYYQFAQYVKPFTNKNCKFFILVDDRYINKLNVTFNKRNNGKRN